MADDYDEIAARLQHKAAEVQACAIVAAISDMIQAASLDPEGETRAGRDAAERLKRALMGAAGEHLPPALPPISTGRGLWQPIP